jgi:hypothetical protein
MHYSCIILSPATEEYAASEDTSSTVWTMASVKPTAALLLPKPPVQSSGNFRFYGICRYFERADERTRTADLLITSVRSVVAEGCTGLQMPHR